MKKRSECTEYCAVKPDPWRFSESSSQAATYPDFVKKKAEKRTRQKKEETRLRLHQQGNRAVYIPNDPAEYVGARVQHPVLLHLQRIAGLKGGLVGKEPNHQKQ
jgi:hypothetical protein